MPSISIYLNDEIYKYLLDKGSSPSRAGKDIIESDFNQQEVETMSKKTVSIPQLDEIKKEFGISDPVKIESHGQNTGYMFKHDVSKSPLPNLPFDFLEHMFEPNEIKLLDVTPQPNKTVVHEFPASQCHSDCQHLSKEEKNPFTVAKQIVEDESDYNKHKEPENATQ